MTPKRVRQLFACAPLALVLALAGCGDDGNSTVNPPIETEIDTTPPAVPLNLLVEGDPNEGTITVQWDENTEADLAGYVLQRSLDRQVTWSEVSATPLTSASYSDLYRSRADYRVAAVDASSNQSAYSDARGFIYIPSDGGKYPHRKLDP
jgi:hypothetical protein